MSVEFHDAVEPFLVAIDMVHQHPENPNNGDVEAIADSILINGFYSVCFAQKSTGTLLAGNHRYEALMSLGATHIPVLFLDVTDDEALALLVGDNEIAAKAIRDDSHVARLVQGLADKGYRLEGMGYTENSLKELVHKVNARAHIPLPEDISVGLPPRGARVYIDGYLDEDGVFTPFEFGDIPETVMRLRDFGYRAIGMEGR